MAREKLSENEVLPLVAHHRADEEIGPLLVEAILADDRWQKARVALEAARNEERDSVKARHEQFAALVAHTHDVRIGDVVEYEYSSGGYGIARGKARNRRFIIETIEPSLGDIEVEEDLRRKRYFSLGGVICNAKHERGSMREYVGASDRAEITVYPRDRAEGESTEPFTIPAISNR